MVAGGEPYGKLAGAAARRSRGGASRGSGPRAEAAHRPRPSACRSQDVGGLWMLPGLIDCHTHLVYGGNRVEEFESGCAECRTRRSRGPAAAFNRR